MTPTINAFVLLPVLVVAAVMIVGQAKFAIHDTPVVGLGAAFNFNISSSENRFRYKAVHERQGQAPGAWFRLDNVIKDQPIGGLLRNTWNTPDGRPSAPA